MKNKEVNGNVVDFREVKEMNENEKEVMENNEEATDEETGIETEENAEETEEWSMEDLEKARKILNNRKKVKKVLKRAAIGITCGVVVCGAAMLIVKKIKKGETVDVDAVKEDVKDVIEGVVE